MSEFSRSAGCATSPIPKRGRRAMRGPRLGKVVLALVVLSGVGTSLGVAAVGPAAASPDAVPAVPGGAVQAVPGTSDLSSVACATPSSCVAVGSVGGENRKGVVVPIVDGVPGTPQVLTGTSILNSVTCISAQSCIAVGFASSNNPPAAAGVVVAIDNGQASITNVVPGTGLPGAPDEVSLNGVACSDTTHCLGVGSAIYEDGFVDGGGQGLSQVLHTISPLAMSGVECVQNDHDWCLADGQTLGGPRDNDPVGLAQFVQIGGSKGRLVVGPSVVFPENTDLGAGACHARRPAVLPRRRNWRARTRRRSRILGGGRVVGFHARRSRHEHVERLGVLRQLLVCRRRFGHRWRGRHRPRGLGDSSRDATGCGDRRVQRGRLSDSEILHRRR